MRIFRTAAAAALGLALAAPALAGEDAGGMYYEPQDECRSDASAAAFLDRLARAVEARDADALVALASEDVHLDFGGGEGREELRARLEGGEEYYGDLWKELATILTLGCASADDGLIMLPWYWGQDFGELDPFSTMLAIRPKVDVRQAPSRDARVIATLEWDPVELAADYDPEAEFVEVVLPNQKRGFVETGTLRSMIDYRLIAEKADAGWQISAFIAGD